MKTNKNTTKEETLKTIDASGRTLGRVASEIAMSLMGKTKATYERNVYSGFPVKVINASKIKITNQKLSELKHLKYSGYPGGLRTTYASETIEKKGFKELLRLSVDRMIPKNKLHKMAMKNLTIEN